MPLKTGLKKYISTAFVISTALIMSPVVVHAAEDPTKGQVSGDITLVSTYLWRGVALTGDAALQGNFHFKDVNGIHGSLFTSNVARGSEMDVAAGFQGNTDAFNYDVGGKLYYLPQYESSNFIEIYVAISKDNFGAKLSVSPDSGTYLEGHVSLPMDTWDLNIHIGNYSVDEDDGGATIPIEDYIDVSLTGSRIVDGYKVGLTLSATTLDDGEVKNGQLTDNFRTVLSVSKAFNP